MCFPKTVIYEVIQFTIKLIYTYVKNQFKNTKKMLFKTIIMTELTVEDLGDKNSKPKEEQRETRKNI